MQAEVQHTEAQVQQAEAKLSAHPGDTLLVEELQHLRKMAIHLRREEELLRAEARILRATERKLLARVPNPPQPQYDYSGMPFFYSTYLAEKLGILTPQGQCVFYLFTGCGLGYGARQLHRAHLLMRAVKETDPREQLGLMHRARASELQLQHASIFANRLFAKRMVGAWQAPILWLAWRMVYRGKPAQGQQ